MSAVRSRFAGLVELMFLLVVRWFVRLATSLVVASSRIDRSSGHVQLISSQLQQTVFVIRYNDKGPLRVL